jgi:hypothetical protein
VTLPLPTTPGTRFRGLCTRVNLPSDEDLLWPAWWFVQASPAGPVYAHEGGARLYPDDIGDAEVIRGLRVVPCPAEEELVVALLNSIQTGLRMAEIKANGELP